MSHTGAAISKQHGDDQWLVDGLQRHDPDAVEALVDRYAGWVHRVAARVLRDQRDAEEVTQDTLMTVVEKIGGFRRESAFSSWLYRIAANAAYERLRSRRSRIEMSLDPALPMFDEEGRHLHAVADWSSRLEDPAVSAEARSALERAIGDLPEEYRIVLVLRDVEGLTTEEVAETVGLTAAAVKSRLHRARLVLRQELAEFFSPRR